MKKTFKEHSENYLNGLESNKYGIIITKHCGYEFIIIIHKHMTLNDLYKHVEHETNNKNFNLFISDNIPIEKCNTTLYNYINELRKINLINPVYKLPDPVIYRIYIDDGHIH